MFKNILTFRRKIRLLSNQRGMAMLMWSMFLAMVIVPIAAFTMLDLIANYTKTGVHLEDNSQNDQGE